VLPVLRASRREVEERFGRPRAPGEVMHRDVIMNSLYGDREVDPKILDVMISHARKKLAGTRLSITAEYGIGYRLNVEK
jgi:DNA-binding response OmpR family regulator